MAETSELIGSLTMSRYNSYTCWLEHLISQ